jgi:hypothetical protein
MPRAFRTSARRTETRPNEAVNCALYRDGRPTCLAKIWNGTFALLSGLGLIRRILLTVQVKAC